jgi:hypothetical protein
MHRAQVVALRSLACGRAGPSITLPSAVLRSSAVELMGSGLDGVPFDRFINAVGELLQAPLPGGLKIAVEPVPLAQVEQAWARDDSGRRIVFTVEAPQ